MRRYAPQIIFADVTFPLSRSISLCFSFVSLSLPVSFPRAFSLKRAACSARPDPPEIFLPLPFSAVKTSFN
jgi:hypothetical protein